VGVYRYRVEVLKPFDGHSVGEVLELTERDGENAVTMLVVNGYVRVLEKEYVPSQTSITRWLT